MNSKTLGLRPERFWSGRVAANERPQHPEGIDCAPTMVYLAPSLPGAPVACTMDAVAATCRLERRPTRTAATSEAIVATTEGAVGIPYSTKVPNGAGIAAKPLTPAEPFVRLRDCERSSSGTT
jgi:hypothetical protein